MSLLVTTCMTLANLLPQADPNPARVVRDIPIRDWLGVADAVPPPRLGSLLGFRDQTTDLLGLREENERLIDPDFITDIAYEQAPEEFDDETMTVSLQGMTLRLTGPRDRVAEVERELQRIASAMVRHVRLRATLYGIEDEREVPIVATAEQFAAVTAGLPELWSGRSTCVSGNAAALHNTRATGYVYDYDVEVAQSSNIGDPKTRSLLEGVQLTVEPHALIGTEELAVFAQFCVGELRGPIETRNIGVDDMPSLHVPHVNTTSGAFSGRIPNGGALLVTVRGAPEAGSRFVLALSASADAPPAGGGTAVLPVSAMLTDALTARVLKVREDYDQPESMVAAEDWGAEDRLDESSLEDQVRSLLQLEDHDGLRLTGNFLLLRAGADVQRDAAQLLAAMQDRQLRTARVRLHTALVPAHAAAAFATAAQGAADSLPATLHEITLPMLIERQHAVVRGHETTQVRDFDVEIAQKSAVANPIVMPVFSGTQNTMMVYPTASGPAAELRVDLTYSSPPKRHATEAKTGGDLYLSAEHTANLGHTGPLANNQPLSLGDGPLVQIGAQTYRARQSVRVDMR